MSEDVEQRVIRVLDGLGVPYEIIAIDPAYADTAEFCEQYGFPPDHAGNTIICASKKEPKQYCACVVTDAQVIQDLSSEPPPGGDAH